MWKSIKTYFFVTFPICFVGCSVLFVIEHVRNVDLGIIPFLIVGLLSNYLAEGLCEKFNWFQK